jgi:hypothetical protein
MAVCGQLEAQLNSTQTEASRLLDSVLHNALNLDFSEQLTQASL